VEIFYLYLNKILFCGCRFEPLRKNLEHVENNLEHVEKNLEHVEKKLEHVENNLEHVENNLEHVEEKNQHLLFDSSLSKFSLRFILVPSKNEINLPHKSTPSTSKTLFCWDEFSPTALYCVDI
jgi:exonuclease VII small subunit